MMKWSGQGRGLLRAAGLAAGVFGAMCMAAFAPATAGERGEASSAAAGDVVTVTDANGDLVELDLGALVAGFAGAQSSARSSGGRSDWKRISEGYEKIESTADGRSLYGLWYNRKTQDLLAELPRGFERQRHYFASTVSGGDPFAGFQGTGQTLYTYWKQYGEDRLALMAPQLRIRSSGEQESRDSVDRLFTDRVIFDVPIVARGPSGQPVIDLDDVLLRNGRTFFGSRAVGVNTRLREVAVAKAFPENIEIAITVPGRGGQLRTFHYSISEIRGTPGYRPREADSRVGYFVTNYDDFGIYDRDEVTTRYINRWHLEKADPRLSLSPPKEPIVWYVEHTVPVRYRRWVREGIEYWNDAFREIGIDGALEVRFQDKSTGKFMDIDPEDVRYNFVRWLNNNVATAIGPSRTNPTTGEILDADVVLTDGWIRAYDFRWQELVSNVVMQSFDPETLAWLDRNPEWDPRVRFAPPAERPAVLAERERARADRARGRGIHRFGAAGVDVTASQLSGEGEYGGLFGTGMLPGNICRAAQAQAMNLASVRMHLSALGPFAPIVLTAGAMDPGEDLPELPPEMLERLKKQLEENPDLIDFVPEAYREALLAQLNETPEGDDSEPVNDDADEDKAEKKAEEKLFDTGDELDGMPEAFVGPMLAELVAHEVGHCLGLRHNFKASAAYDLAEINSVEMKGEKPWSTSVMDYNGVNIRVPLAGGESGEMQGDFSVIDIGPYDMFAIEYGYTFDDPKKVLEKSTDPLHAYATDEDTWGPDPLARRYDISKDPLDYAKNQVALADKIIAMLLEGFVEDGDSWSRARRGYRIAMAQKTSAVSLMANWVGGAFINRDKKGQEDGRTPIEVVPAERQRAALNFAIENTFYDEAYGFTPELLRHLTVDKWIDDFSTIVTDPTYSVHDSVLSTQSMVLTMLMNPTTLRRVYDNQKFVEEGEDVFTLGEMMRTLSHAVWSELEGSPNGAYTDASPMISTMRRNLQREVLEKLIDLTMPQGMSNAASKPIANLAALHLRRVRDKAREVANRYAGRIDDLTLAHLEDIDVRATKALEAEYIYNLDDLNSGSSLFSLMLGQEAEGERDE